MPQEIRLEHTKEEGHNVSMQKIDWGGAGRERLVGTDVRSREAE